MNTDKNSLTSQQVWIISGNDLLLGDLVYFSAEDQWTRKLSEATTFGIKESAEAALVRAQSDEDSVVGADLVSALMSANQAIELTHFRDRFRESGPTHRADLSRSH